ncbi:MAG: hypothetical protein IT426_06245 [Pirellulales bacterium]|nr:hypothetical protein [Pirellulales bacterium]
MTAIAVAAVLPDKNYLEFEAARAFCFIFFFFGGPFGYLAGGLIAGIFLFREREERAAADAEENQES